MGFYSGDLKENDNWEDLNKDMKLKGYYRLCVHVRATLLYVMLNTLNNTVQQDAKI
jgi:hypothetical protein